MIEIYWPTDETEARELVRARIENLRLVSDTHRRWFTHKNPYGCWICDMLEVLENLDRMVKKQSVEHIIPSPPTDLHDSSV